MKIVLIAQEEPVYFGPFFRGIINAKAKDIALVVIAGKRGAGSHPKTLSEKIKNFYSLWLLFESKGFLRNLSIRIYQKLISFFGLIGTRFDTRCIEGLAKKYRIPVIHTSNVNSAAFLTELEKYAPDLIINQSEMLLKKELLSIPKIGVLNRHASLLPRFRGRLGSFWAHAEEKPQYGTTIHFVDEKIDSGPIIAQKSYDLDPRLSYTQILDQLFHSSLALILDAIKNLENPNFTPIPNEYKKTSTYLFPTLKEIRNYRKILKIRRKN